MNNNNKKSVVPRSHAEGWIPIVTSSWVVMKVEPKPGMVATSEISALRD
jgi:hypothetical protein